MPAVGVVTTTRLTAFTMIFLRDLCTFTCPTIATFVLASMAAGLQRSANRIADVEKRADIDMAWNCDLVLTFRYYAIDHDTALCFCRILILPARQVVDVVPAWQQNIDVGNDNTAFLVALAAALVWAVVITAFLHPVAGLGAIDGLVETVRMTLVHAGVAARKTSSTQEITSCFW